MIASRSRNAVTGAEAGLTVKPGQSAGNRPDAGGHLQRALREAMDWNSRSRQRRKRLGLP